MRVAPQPIAGLRAVPPLEGILCDIDDTLTHHGRLVPAAFAMLARARSAGLKVVPITGRPGGWVDQIARMWPVDGCVGENGGLWYWLAEGSSPPRLERRFAQDAVLRARNRAALDAASAAILAEVPGTALASDQPYRELDLAIDFCEDVPALPKADVARIVRAFETRGATCKVSSIHVNGWFGDFDKLAGFERFHQDRWGQPPDLSRWAFFGDSANDAPMFGAFALSVGVANVAEFLDRMDHWPTWITAAEGGHGFVEGMERILALRG